MEKKIKLIVPSQLVNMGGIILDQPLPYRGIEQIDPFLLIHHWKNTLDGGKEQSALGVGPHPHRGFSPITFVFKGGVHHRDSLGISSEVFAGGVQWMNSGKGIIHSERPVKELAEYGGDFEIIQLWINTPVKHKMDDPAYYPLHAKDIPTWKSADGLAEVHVVNGSYNGLVGSIKSFSELLVYRLEMKKGASIDLPAPQNHNTILYLLDGEIFSGDERGIAKDLCVYQSEGDRVLIEAKEDASAIYLSGVPLNESLFMHGPFVMSSASDISEAINDYQSGKMGTLNEEFD